VVTDVDVRRSNGAHATFALDGRPETVPRARRFVTAMLDGAGLAALADDAALVATELTSNALLHAGGAPALLRVGIEEGPTVRIEVEDANPLAPLPQQAGARRTTGRGLGLVHQLSEGWGVDPRPDHRAGKVVWAVLRPHPEPVEVPEQGIDLEALLARWPDDEPDVAPPGPFVDLTGIPTRLYLEADEHLDGLVRELQLAAADGVAHRLRPGLVATLAEELNIVESYRRHFRRAALEARSRDQDTFAMRLQVVPPEHRVRSGLMAILAEADQYARDARLLTLESPVQFGVMRRWIDVRVRAEMERIDAGEPPAGEPSFEEFLLAELGRLDTRLRSTALAATLQEVTAALAAAETADEIADIAVGHGCETLHASGGVLIVIDADQNIRFRGSRGTDTDLEQRFLPMRDEDHGPARVASLSGQPVYLESPEERDARFPRLVEQQPEVASLVIMPLIVAGEAVGVLRFAFDRAHLFDQDERGYLQGLAGQAALAFARVRLLFDVGGEDERSGADRLAPLTRELSDQGAMRLAGLDIALLRTLYGEAPIGVAMFDADCRYVRLNRALASTHYGTWAEQIGMTVEQALGPVEGAVLRERIEGVFASGETVTADDFWIVDVHGTRRLWRSHWFPIRGSSARVDAVLAVATDITEEARPR
jgi:PAS domain S-box-containing protein